MQRSDEETPIERSLEVVNLAIDGEATPGEQAELNDLLKASERAREIHASLRELSGRLDAIPLLDPPPGLKEEVLAELHSRNVVRFPIERRRAWSRRRVIFTAAWAAAAVILILLAVRSFLSSWPESLRRLVPSDAAATMAPAGADAWPLVQRLSSFSDPNAASLIVRRKGDFYSLEPVHSKATAPVTVRWEASKLALVDVWPNDASVAKQAAEVTFDPMPSRAGVILRSRRRGSEPAKVVVAIGDREIVRGVVPLN